MSSLGPNNRVNPGLLQFPAGPSSLSYLRDNGLMNSGTSNGNGNVDIFMAPQLPQAMLNLAALQPQQGSGANNNLRLPQQRNSLVGGTLPIDNRSFSFMDQLPGRQSMFGKDSFNDFGGNGSGSFIPNQGPTMHELLENMPQRHKMSMHLGHGKGNDK